MAAGLWRLAVVCLFAGGALGAASNPAPADAQTARVVVVRDDGATVALQPEPEVVRRMVDRGVMALTRQPNPRAAWLSLVSTQDTVGLKVFSLPGPLSGTRPAVAAAVAGGLMEAGIPPERIFIWDKDARHLASAGYYALGRQLGVQVEAVSEQGYDETKTYERALIGNLLWGDYEFGKKGEGVGRRSFAAKLVTRKLTRIINLTPLLNHNEAGVTGHLYSLATGSMDNTLRFESNPLHLAEAVPEIYALEILGDRVALNITDALICQYQGENRTLLHYATVLNELRFSRDPVALDTLALADLEQQRQRFGAPARKLKGELLHNASLLWLGVSDRTRITIETIP